MVKGWKENRVTNGAGRNALVPPSSEEVPHIAYLPSVEKVTVFVKTDTALVNKVPRSQLYSGELSIEKTTRMMWIKAAVVMELDEQPYSYLLYAPVAQEGECLHIM